MYPDSVAPKTQQDPDSPMAPVSPPHQEPVAASSPPVTPRRTPARKSSAPNGSSSATPNNARGKAATPRGKTPVKAASQTARMLNSELPDDAKGLKVCPSMLVYSLVANLQLQKAMIMHIRLLSGWVKASDVPLDPPDQVLAEFQKQVAHEEDLQVCRHGSPVFPPSLVQVGRVLAVGDRGHISRFLQTVSDHILEYIQMCLAKFGLLQWCPDLRQSPDSLYNQACRIIALDTFKQALVAHVYDSLQPDKRYISKTEFLAKIYNHFVHFYLHELYKKDARVPGSVQAAEGVSPVYRNRARVRNFVYSLYLIFVN